MSSKNEGSAFLDFFTTLDVTLFHIPGSLSSPLVQAVHEMHIAVELLHIKKIDLKNTTILELNPLGQVPIFVLPCLRPESGETVLVDVGCIAMYFMEKYDDGFKFHPNPKENLEIWTNFMHLFFYIITTVYPLFADNLNISENRQRWVNIVAPHLESHIICWGNKFITGNNVSILDFLMGPALNDAKDLGILSDFPALESYFQRLRKRPSWAPAYSTDAPSYSADLAPDSADEPSPLLLT